VIEKNTFCKCGCEKIVKTKGHEFYPGHARIGGHYKGEWRDCLFCRQNFWVVQSRLKYKKYCSKKCMTAFRKRKNLRSDNPNWRGGKTVISNRPSLYIPEHPRSTKDGYVYEHIVIAERAIGRYLKFIRNGHKDNEVVHHIDGDFKNNSNKNLLILNSWHHKSLHMKLRHRKIDCRYFT
jgi:hypothetical protein